MKLRKVKIKRYLKNTGKYDTDFNDNGFFHEWGCDFEEFKSGPGNYTVGIIELMDGTIEKVEPQYIKFID